VATHKKRVLLIALLLAGIGGSFGYFSRYPDLNHKALMAEKATVADTISMWPILKVKSYDPLWKKIAYTTVNWAHDNRKGMVFGLVIAALLATLFTYVRFKPSSKPMLNVFYGFILGTPLGVCVNCAAPVFKGMLKSRRIEMALAVMFASPTLNVVVVTMAFSLLPFYMAATKLLFNLAVIFLLVPVMAKRLARWPVADIAKLEAQLPGTAVADESPVFESWPRALWGLVKDFGRQFGSLVVRTVPLMLVAGFLGSLLSHVVPLDALRGANGPVAFTLAALAGLILPVPMAFDVVLTHALYSAGLPAQIAMILLLSLGVYSFYSFLIVWQSASRNWALTLSAALLCMITPIGLVAQPLHETFYLAPNVAAYKEMSGPTLRRAHSEDLGAPAAHSEAKGWTAESPLVDGALTAVPYPFFGSAPGAAARFEAIEGPELGIDRGFVYTIRDYPDPFWIGRGTASGDFDRDGWPDLALGSDGGLLLYRNVGGRFERVEVAPELKERRVFAVAFVDLNNDGWLDLFATTWLSGNYYLINEAGRFPGGIRALPNGDGVLTVSPSFADLDRDGYLDVFNGNMALGIATGFRAYGKGRVNGITYNKKLNFQFAPLPGADGETMASILSDLNGDGYPDLYQNNDFIVPDLLSFGRPGGKWNHLTGPAVKGFATPIFSMSVDTGDIDNDQRLDLLVTGTIAARQDLGSQLIDGVKPEVYKKAKDSVEYCSKIKDPTYRASCELNRKSDHLVPFSRLKNLNVKDCQKLGDGPGAIAREECLLSMMWMIVTNNDDNADCQTRYGFDPIILEVCQLMRRAGAYHAKDSFESEAPQLDRAVLYRTTAEGGIAPVSFEHPGGWTWSSKFGDLDNDGWLDIFNAEGAVRQGEWGFNVFLHNQGGGKFEQRQFTTGLVNDFNLFSFTLIDFDRDGDLDLIGNGSEGPVQVYRNNLARGKSVAFALQLPPAKANQLGVGAKIAITDSSGRKQIREVKSGGGYLSFDAPEVYFGLGDAEAVTRVELVRPDGSRSEHPLTLPAGRLYRLSVND
jgi:uncharacterized membrane protein YraQ (UPF0718 family)